MVGPKASLNAPSPLSAAALRATMTDRTERILAIHARIRSARPFKLTLQCTPFAHAAQTLIDARFVSHASRSSGYSCGGKYLDYTEPGYHTSRLKLLCAIRAYAYDSPRTQMICRRSPGSRNPASAKRLKFLTSSRAVFESAIITCEAVGGTHVRRAKKARDMRREWRTFECCPAWIWWGSDSGVALARVTYRKVDNSNTLLL